MNNPMSAKCFLGYFEPLQPILALKMRRSKKLSCKKGGVDCRVSRRERDIPNTFTPTTYPLLRFGFGNIPQLVERHSQSVTWKKTFSWDATSLASYRED